MGCARARLRGASNEKAARARVPSAPARVALGQIETRLQTTSRIATVLASRAFRRGEADLCEGRSSQTIRRVKNPRGLRRLPQLGLTLYRVGRRRRPGQRHAVEFRTSPTRKLAAERRGLPTHRRNTLVKGAGCRSDAQGNGQRKHLLLEAGKRRSALAPFQTNRTRIPHIPSMITVAMAAATTAPATMNRSANTLLTPCEIMTARAPAARCARTKNAPSQ